MKTLNLTDAEISAQWSAGNDAGEGYAVGDPSMSPREAAETEGWTDIRTFDAATSTGHCVVARHGQTWVAICDANGPWAVDIS